jgi:hypothetical protein
MNQNRSPAEIGRNVVFLMLAQSQGASPLDLSADHLSLTLPASAAG